jgi:hypothetical protein
MIFFSSAKRFTKLVNNLTTVALAHFGVSTVTVPGSTLPNRLAPTILELISDDPTKRSHALTRKETYALNTRRSTSRISDTTPGIIMCLLVFHLYIQRCIMDPSILNVII